MYFVKTPRWLKKIYGNYIWDIKADTPTLYLTFDDGPHPEVTYFVLNELEKYNAKATFFCIGKNVLLYPHVYKAILDKGHAIGNHTHNHFNGWKTPLQAYIDNVAQCEQYVQSSLFRPPYGRIKNSQAKYLRNKGFSIIMWDVLSGDFDTSIDGNKCSSNVINNAASGSIIVFHDSEKAFERLKYALPATLDYFSRKGYGFKPLDII